MEKYWNKAINFEQYLEETKSRFENPKTEEDREKKPYYELGIQRMERMLKVFRPSEEDLKTLEDKKFKGKILIISEGWCGDASQCVPVLDTFFKDKNEVRIFYRDADTSLIDQFLTNGARAIPKVLILDENFNVKNTWGPRPAYGLELFKKFKADPQNYPRETFYNDLQVYYAKNRGKDTVKEILELI
ncbi:thioredoxin family protein [Riemerella columbipharyngis]|uniref:Thioredoxin n=1 Tax=Riemerella columbipharyngis TaxID=1071918 RepID=A0A1G7CXF6_9FLAO|nr:thioredoxin family protein [Riemerella columbipharyngis]SDE44022.1 Thioredoxin [Riemerella columbipharyngis]